MVCRTAQLRTCTCTQGLRPGAAPRAQGGQRCLYDGARAAAALRRKRLFLAGHGPGGALAAAFAQLLHTWPDAPAALAQARPHGYTCPDDALCEAREVETGLVDSECSRSATLCENVLLAPAPSVLRPPSRFVTQMLTGTAR